jgi:hypothetical protein
MFRIRSQPGHVHRPRRWCRYLPLRCTEAKERQCVVAIVAAAGALAQGTASGG